MGREQPEGAHFSPGAAESTRISDREHKIDLILDKVKCCVKIVGAHDSGGRQRSCGPFRKSSREPLTTSPTICEMAIDIVNDHRELVANGPGDR
jgi:hypothetical protein